MARRDLVSWMGIGGLAGIGAVASTPGAEAATGAIRMEDFERGPSSILVAAADAPIEIRDVAHERCDGTNDQVKIQNALDRLGGTGGLVQLSEGTFHVSGAVRLKRRCALAGRGRATILKASGTWAAYDGTSPGAVIEPWDDGTDKTRDQAARHRRESLPRRSDPG